MRDSIEPDRPPMTARRLEIMERMKKINKKIKERMNGHKIIHLSCGWTGDELVEGKCPRCGESYTD